MRSRLAAFLLAALALGTLATKADAKKFRYSSGPKPPADTTLAVANPYLDPVVGARGPRVPYTNLQVAGFVADSAVAAGLAGVPLESGVHVVLAPTRDHPMNFVLEDALVDALTSRGVQVTIRRSPIPDDSVGTGPVLSDPILEYTTGSVRTTYVRLVGFLPGRVKVERQTLVTGVLGLRDPATSRVLWTGRMAQSFVDRFPRSQVALVEDARYTDLKDTPPERNVDKVFEPIIVVAVVGGLVALFFQNRP